jgi:hypothetical protein
VGACTQEFGGLTLWLINCVNVVTRHFDREGGMMFPEPAVDLTRAYGSKGHYGKFRSRVRNLPEFGNELPVATLADEIQTPGAGQVRALITFAGNPSFDPTTAARSRPDDSTSWPVDLYTRRCATHVILPPTSPLEHGHTISR